MLWLHISWNRFVSLFLFFSTSFRLVSRSPLASNNMRLSPVLLLLPAMAIAEDQKPLKEKAAAWLDKAKSYIPSAAPPSPIDAGASKVAGLVLEKITNDNWRRKMLPVTGDPSAGPQEWMVMFSGNTSCNGRCQEADRAYNVPRDHPLLRS